MKQQPAWLLVANEAGKSPDPCPGCGEVSDAKASICKHCRHVFHPLKAYEAGLIEYGHVAMDRLSPEDRRKALALKAERERVKREAESKAELGSETSGASITAPAGVNGKAAVVEQ